MVQAIVTLKTVVGGAADAAANVPGRAIGAKGRLTGRRRAWTALALLAISLVAVPVGAQEQCIPDDWDDIALFRRCIEEPGLRDGWATSMLHFAAEFTGNPAVIQLLLDADADPNDLGSMGLTPLHWGAANSNPVVTARLLAAGGDPNALNDEGYTPLHYAAAQQGNGRVVTRLLRAGADPLAESNDGRTPLHSALRSESVRAVSALVQAGGAEGLSPPAAHGSARRCGGGNVAAGGGGRSERGRWLWLELPALRGSARWPERSLRSS